MGNTSSCDKPRLGRPMTAKEDKSGQERVEEMIPENN